MPFREAVKAWFAISLQTFGGPAGQIAVMQRTLVDEKRWIGQRRFLHALNYCMLLPGPEAQQLAIYIGWLLNGVAAAWSPAPCSCCPAWSPCSPCPRSTSATATPHCHRPVPRPRPRRDRHRHPGRDPGQQPRPHPPHPHRARRRLVPRPHLLRRPVPRRRPRRRRARLGARPVWPAITTQPTRRPRRRAAAADQRRRPARRPAPSAARPHPRHRPAAWARAVLAVGLAFGRASVFVDQGLFFSGAALVTFGGAYAVLAYVAQQAVNVYGWLLPGEMVRGLALAETTPGPLIMVVQFVAFLGAYRDPGDLNPWVAAVLAALLTTWVTFVPCFLFILLGAPYVERLRDNHALSAALTGITAAVVGVIANLAVYFALHTLFTESQRRHGPIQVQIPVLAASPSPLSRSPPSPAC